MPAAPTPAYILSAGYDLGIQCKTCRELRYPKDLALSLVTAGRGDTPVDRLPFRCAKCGRLGVPWVTAAGNALVGRERLWPP
jgi:hypothetical protein